MSPATLLSLWRDRWHKPHHPEHSVPLVHGKIARWTMDTARSDNWAVPGLAWAAFAVAAFALALATGTQLSTNSQIVLGWTLVAFAVYLRRHRGQVVALAIVAMSVLLGARYFYWRIDSTLLDYWSASLVLGVMLLAAELLVWLRFGLGYIEGVWPLENESDALPQDAIEWPTVDIFLLARNTSSVSVNAFVSELKPLDWPANKYRITVLSAEENESLAAVCKAAGIGLECVGGADTNNTAALVQFASQTSESDLLFFADFNTPLTPGFLRRVMGWFLSEQQLGLLTSPHSFLVPPPSNLVSEYLGGSANGVNWSIVRRSALLGVLNTVESGPKADPRPVLALQEAGYFTAYLCFHSDPAGNPEITRIDEPFKPISLWMRVCVRRLKVVLSFYASVAYVVFGVIPVAVLCAGAVPIATDFFTLSAYWLPQWVLGRLALATALEHQRLRWLDFVQEELSGFAVLIRTAKSFLKTHMNRLIQRVRTRKKRLARNNSTEIPTSPQLALNAMSLFFFALVALTLLRWNNVSSTPLAGLYVAWAIFLSLTSLATLAVQREQDWIAWTQANNHRLRAMISIHNSRVVAAGTTQNFPTIPLVIETSRSDLVKAGEAIYLSIFHRHHESVFLCTVDHVQGSSITLAFAPSQLGQYRELTSAVFSRPMDWPMWLPPRNADRLLPGWLAKLLHRALDAFYNLTVKSAIPTILQRLRSRLKLGNTTNG